MVVISKNFPRRSGNDNVQTCYLHKFPLDNIALGGVGTENTVGIIIFGLTKVQEGATIKERSHNSFLPMTKTGTMSHLTLFLPHSCTVIRTNVGFYERLVKW